MFVLTNKDSQWMHSEGASIDEILMDNSSEPQEEQMLQIPDISDDLDNILPNLNGLALYLSFQWKPSPNKLDLDLRLQMLDQFLEDQQQTSLTNIDHFQKLVYLLSFILNIVYSYPKSPFQKQIARYCFVV